MVLQTSPAAGNPDCDLTIATGSSLPTYDPAIKFNLSVLIAAAISLSSFLITRFITYLLIDQEVRVHRTFLQDSSL